ncbi:MAG: glycosyltransferase [Clostridia bacterium]|nr:glycosyltransferase [Clostridia bacterium]
MRIAIFTDSFLPGVGGTENAVLGLATELSKENEVAVFCPSCKKEVENLPFKVFRCKSIGIGGNDQISFPRFSSKFKKEIKNFAPDIIHCQSVSGVANAGLRYARKNNIPVLFTIHTKFKDAFEQGLKFKFLSNAYLRLIAKRINKSDLCCTVCQSMVDEIGYYDDLLKKQAEEPPRCKDVKIIRNGMVFEREILSEDIKKFALDKYKLGQASAVLLFVGRISKLKNLDLVFETLKNLKNQNYKMLVVGVGQDLNYYKKLVKKEGLEEKVVFTGKVPIDELKSIYYNADLFVFPSIFDNDPLVVTEASLFQTPSITLAGTGSSERITDMQNGFIAKDEKDFAEKIDFLIENKHILKECGEKAEWEIPKSWETVAKEYMEVYKKLIKAKK